METRSTEQIIADYKLLSDIESDRIIETGLTLLTQLTDDANRPDRAYVFTRIGMARINLGEYESAFHALAQSREIHEELNDIEGVLSDQLVFAIIYDLTEQQETAFETLLSIRDKARDFKLPELEEAANCNIGHICVDLKRYDEGVGFLQAAEKIVEKTGNISHKTAILHEMGRLELERGQLNEATAYLEEAQLLASDRSDLFSYEILISLGELYSRLSRFDDALFNLKQSLNLCRDNGIHYGEIQTLYYLGNLYKEMGEPNTAAEYWECCYNQTDVLTLRQFRIQSGERLVEYYKQEKEFEKALNVLETNRNEEQDYQHEKLHHTISIYDQSIRIEDLDQEMQAWRRRSGELERIRSDKRNPYGS